MRVQTIVKMLNGSPIEVDLSSSTPILLKQYFVFVSCEWKKSVIKELYFLEGKQ